MKTIKYRAWDNLQGGKFEYWDAKTNKHDGVFWEMIKNKSFEKPDQFTGKTDKNGKEIFEGDIVKCRIIMYSDKEHQTREVFFDEGMFKIGNVSLHIVTMDSSFAPEIIGNIHENPELK